MRLRLFILAYNRGNFFRRLALPEEVKRWSLTSVLTRLINTDGRLVRHARRLVFKLAEVRRVGICSVKRWKRLAGFAQHLGMVSGRA